MLKMLKMLKIVSLLSLLIISSAAFASPPDIRIVSAGSKTGTLSMQSSAYANDLASLYDVTLWSPGNFCEAVMGLDTKKPTLFVWSSDHEALMRQGKCPGAPKLNFKDVIRYDKNTNQVCSMKWSKEEFIGKNQSKRIGTTSAGNIFGNLVSEINSAFATKHIHVPYSGNGLARVALVNGEVDFLITSNDHALFVESNGGKCFGLMEKADPTRPHLTSIQDLAPNKDLSFSFVNVVYALNMTTLQKQSLVNQLKDAHKNCNSAIAKYVQCQNVINFVWDIDQVLENSWEKEAILNKKRI